MRRRDFTLLEVTVLLAVLAAIIASVAPMTLKLVARAKRKAAEAEMRKIHRAIVGDVEKGRAAFLADMGRVPKTLSELVERGSLPLYHTDTTYEVGMGWNGPYLQKSREDVLTDPFGNRYEYSPEPPVQVRSPGPDGKAGTDDDIVHPPSGIVTDGRARVELARSGEYAVRLYCSDGGQEAVRVDEDAPFVFDSVHRGPHALEVVQGDAEAARVVHRTVVYLDGPRAIYRIEF